MHRLLLISLLLAAGSVSLGLLAPLPVTAAASDGEPFSRRPVAGVGADGTEFLGTLYVQRFAADGGRLVAIGSLSGQLTRTTGAVAQPVRTLRNVAVRAPVAGIAATCEALEVRFAPVRPDPQSPPLQADPLRHEGGGSGADGLERALRCSLASRLAAGAPAGELAALLDAMLKLLV